MNRPTTSRSIVVTPSIVASFIVASLIVVAAWWFGLRSPTVEMDRHEYQHVMALYRACNQRDIDAVDVIATRLSQSDDAAGIVPSDADAAIEAIFDTARRHRWDDAARMCRRLMNDQVQVR